MAYDLDGHTTPIQFGWGGGKTGKKKKSYAKKLKEKKKEKGKAIKSRKAKFPDLHD